MSDRYNNIGFKSVAKYALLPGIIPLLKRIIGRFGEFLHMFTMIFGTVGLIDRHHPCMRPENIGRYRFVDIIGLAAHNVVFDRKHLPQTIMFFSVLLAIVLCIAFVVISLLYSTTLVSAAHAQYYSEPVASGYTRQTDWAFIFLNNVFGKTGIGNLIWTLSDTDPGNGSSKLQMMFRAMLAQYAFALLVLAVFQLIYIMVTTLIETAQTGAPFGKKFNNVWAPIRLALAIGLMVPISAGYNAAQLIVFQMSDWGSNLATNVWVTGLDQLKNDKFLQATTPDRGYRFIRGLWLAEVCMASWNKHNGSGGTTLPNTHLGMGVWSASITLPPRDQVMPNKAWFGDNIYVEARYGTQVNPTYCGSFRIPVKQGNVKIKDGNGQEVIVNKFGVAISEQYDKIFEDLHNDMRPAAELFVKKINEDCALNEVQALKYKHYRWIMNGYWKNLGYNLPLYTGEKGTYVKVNLPINSVKKLSLLGKTMTSPAVDFPKEINDTNSAMLQLIQNAHQGGWASAGAFYMTISYANGALHNAVTAIPTVVELPKPLGGPKFTPNQPSVTNKDDDDGFLSWLFSSRDQRALDAAKKTYSDLQKADAWFALAPLDNDYMMSWLGDQYRSTIMSDQSRSSQQQNADTATDQKIRPLLYDGMFGVASGDVNPLGRLVSLGGRFMSIAMLLYGMSIVGSIALTGGSSALGSLLASVGTLFGMAGFALALYLPMLPFIFFTFAVIEWVMSILEAVIGMPLWALSMITVQGEGIGQTAEKGFMKMIGILLQPTIIVITLVASLIMFSAALTFFNGAFAMFTSSYSDTAGGGGGGNITGIESFGASMVGMVGFTFLYVFACYSIGQSCFKLIPKISNGFMDWIGGPRPFSDVMDAGLAGYNNYVAMNQLKDLQGGISGSIKGVGGDVMKGAKDRKDKADQSESLQTSYNMMPDDQKGQFQTDGKYDEDKFKKHATRYNSDSIYRQGYDAKNAQNAQNNPGGLNAQRNNGNRGVDPSDRAGSSRDDDDTQGGRTSNSGNYHDATSAQWSTNSTAAQQPTSADPVPTPSGTSQQPLTEGQQRLQRTREELARIRDARNRPGGNDDDNGGNTPPAGGSPPPSTPPTGAPPTPPANPPSNSGAGPTGSNANFTPPSSGSSGYTIPRPSGGYSSTTTGPGRPSDTSANNPPTSGRTNKDNDDDNDKNNPDPTKT